MKPEIQRARKFGGKKEHKGIDDEGKESEGKDDEGQGKKGNNRLDE